MKTLVFDIETNGLLHYSDAPADRVWVISVSEYGTNEVTTYGPEAESIREGIAYLGSADCLVGHNIIGYDLPLLKHLYNFEFNGSVVDTLVLARLAWPEIAKHDANRKDFPSRLVGSHSLEAFGFRLGVLKVEVKDEEWAEFSPLLVTRCETDVQITTALYRKCLTKELPDEAVELEHEVFKIVQRQMSYGWLFDMQKAGQLYATLVGRKAELEPELEKLFAPMVVNCGKFVPKVNNKKLGYVKGRECYRIKTVPFNPNSRQQIAAQLMRKYNWKPTDFTASGQPKIDDEVLEALPFQEAKMLAEYLMISKRLSQLAEGKSGKDWMHSISRDGRIHGHVNSVGTVTFRMRHMYPNMAQVPALKSPYGGECRELFTVAAGKKLVGADASGLELRCLAHFMAMFDGGEYAQVVSTGDVHTTNQKAAGLPTRDESKRFIYAFLYGAGDEKLAGILGCSINKARAIRRKFLKELIALDSLLSAVKGSAKRGFLYGLDGRKLYVRSEHSALNTLLQSAGALIMKRALVILDAGLQSAGLIPGVNYEFVGNIHDEWQIEADEDKAELVGNMAVKAIRSAGEYYKFRCPLDGEYRIGDNWKETH